MPPRPGDTTPPNPEYSTGDSTDDDGRPAEKNFCVWTSMLQRSVSTAQFFDDEEYDIKEMRMLNELSAGVAEGLTYAFMIYPTPCIFSDTFLAMRISNPHGLTNTAFVRPTNFATATQGLEENHILMLSTAYALSSWRWNA